jgi:hypothetical protein
MLWIPAKVRSSSRPAIGLHSKGLAAMRGITLGFDYGQGSGVISGDDGDRYSVAKDDLGPGIRTLIPGRSVDFLVQDGRAVSVFPIKGRFQLDEKNKWVAAALAFFLGIFGIHKFYLGKKKAGIIMLLGFFPGMLLIIPLIAVAYPVCR